MTALEGLEGLEGLQSLEVLSLAAALRTGIALPWHENSTLQGVFYTWLETYDRGEKAREPVEAPVANEMHVVGACVCILLGRSPQLQGAYDLRDTLGPLYDKMIFTEKPLAEYELEDLQNLVTALQPEFPNMHMHTVGVGYGVTWRASVCGGSRGSESGWLCNGSSSCASRMRAARRAPRPRSR